MEACEACGAAFCEVCSMCPFCGDGCPEECWEEVERGEN